MTKAPASKNHLNQKELLSRMKFLNKKTIKLDKVLNKLDKLALEFTKILTKQKIRYVIVSGHVAILFGRSRASEDIDIIIEKLDLKKFNELWQALCKEFECLNTGTAQTAYEEYLLNNCALRFSRKEDFGPNIEMKFVKVDLDNWTLDERMKVFVNEKLIFISPIELEIPFKIFLGSEKDIEDARFLYRIFKEKLDNALMQEFVRKLKVEKE